MIPSQPNKPENNPQRAKVYSEGTDVTAFLHKTEPVTGEYRLSEPPPHLPESFDNLKAKRDESLSEYGQTPFIKIV